MIFYTSTSDGILKSFNEETKQTHSFDISDVEQILIDSGNVFAITHKTDEKAIYRFDYSGDGKKKISGDSKVSYAIAQITIIYAQ